MATILTFPDKHDASAIIPASVESRAGASSLQLKTPPEPDISHALSQQSIKSAEIIIFPGVRIEHISEGDNYENRATDRAVNFTKCGIDLTAN